MPVPRFRRQLGRGRDRDHRAVGELIRSTTITRVRGEQAAAYADTIASSSAPTGWAAATTRAPVRAA